MLFSKWLRSQLLRPLFPLSFTSPWKPLKFMSMNHSAKFYTLLVLLLPTPMQNSGKPQKWWLKSNYPNFSNETIKSATEIRCQEKCKGGLRYEVILAEPGINQVQVPKVVQQSAAPRPLSAQEISEKLKAAEERRLVSWTWQKVWRSAKIQSNYRAWRPRKSPTGQRKWLRLKKRRAKRTS